MRCQDIQQQLCADFLDKELSPVKKAEVDRHLEGCAACREFFAAVKQVNDPLFAVNSARPAERVWEKVRERVEVKPFWAVENVRGWFEEVLWGFRPTFVYGSIVAAMCVALIIPVGLYREQTIARADKEDLVQLVYADDNTTVLGVDSIGSGTVVEHWL